jgi:hypothetical protein
MAIASFKGNSAIDKSTMFTRPFFILFWIASLDIGNLA